MKKQNNIVLVENLVVIKLKSRTQGLSGLQLPKQVQKVDGSNDGTT